MPQGLDGSRVQAPETPDAAPLQVADSSGLNFFVAPAKAPEDDRLGQLAQALGPFDTGLKQLGRYYNISQRVHDGGQTKADMEAAQGLIASKTPEEWQQAVKDGTLPRYQSPMAQLAVDRTTGQYAAHALSLDVSGKVATGELNWADGSAMKYMSEQRANILKTNGWDPTTGQSRGFGDGYNTLYNNAQSQAMKGQAEATNASQVDAAQKQYEMAVSNGFAQKLPPDQMRAQLDAVRKGLVQTMHFEPKELDGMEFDALNRRSGQDPNWVMGVGQAPRTDVDGKTPIPSLFSKGQYLNQVNQLQQRQYKFNVDAEEAKQKDIINGGVAQLLNTDPSKVAGLAQQIRYDNPVDGTTSFVPKETAINAAVNARIDADNKRVASGSASPDQVMDEQLNTFAQAGIKQHQWAAQLNAVGQGSANVTTLTDPKQQGTALSAYQLYSSLRVKNPGYLDSLMDQKAKTFFNMAFMQQSIFGKSPLEAMQSAGTILASPKNPEEQHDLDQQRQLIDTTAAGLKFGTSGWFGADAVKNPEIAKGALTEAARALMSQSGMTAEDAIKAATPYVQNAFVNINGQLVQDLHYLPKEQMKPAAEKYLSDWATGPAKALNLDPKSLSIAPAGTGRYLIVDASSGLPIMAPRTGGQGQGGMTFVSPRDLIQSSQALQADARKAAEQKTQAAATGAARVQNAHQYDRANGLELGTQQ